MRASSINAAPLAAVPMAMATTLGLLLLMYSLINTRFEAIELPPPTKIVSVLMPPIEIEPPRPLAPTRPTEVAQAPATPEPLDIEYGTNTQAIIDIAPPQTPTPGNHLSGLQEGNYLPIIQVAPQYPQNAASRGIEGFVTVSFTVTTNGTTRDIQVINAVKTDGTPTSIFNKAAIAAAAKFKYKPRVENGVASEVHDVRNRFVFELAR